MPRYICLLLLLVATAMGSYAQPVVKGIVKDTARAAVPYCPVALLRAKDSSVVKGTITDEDGSFAISQITKGDYLLKVSAVNFAEWYSAVVKTDSQTDVDMGLIMLKSSMHNLGEVSVKADKPLIEFKHGVIVLNVQNDLLASGNTVLELLKRLPGVVVDAQNNVTVNGKAGVSFMMDGRLQQIPAAQMITMLSNMNADQIASIELIKNPPAKYDAAGTAGLINIVSKKVKIKGISGSVVTVAGHGKGSGDQTTLDLNYKTNKLTIFTNTTYWNRSFVTDQNMNRTLTAATGNTTIDLTGQEVMLRSVFEFKGGLEYELTKNTSIGCEINAYPNSLRKFATNRTVIDGYNANNYSSFTNTAADKDFNNVPAVSVYGVHNYDTAGSQLKLSADYTDYIDNYDGLSRNRFYDNTNTEVDQMLAYHNFIDLNFKIATAKVDYTKVISKALTLEAGAKGSFVNNINNNSLLRNVPGMEVYNSDTSFANKYDYKEQIYAAYVSVTREFKKGTVQLGLRGEQTDVNAVNKETDYKLTQNYFKLFPNLNVEYPLNEKNTLEFSYSYRIDRPEYNDLNPVKNFVDPLSYGAGNPALKPEYTHKLELEWNYNNFLHSSIAFQHTTNSIYYYSFTKNDGSQVNVDTVFNYSFTNGAMLNVFVQKQVVKWFSTQVSANLIYGERNGIIDSVNSKTKTFSVFATMNNTLSLPKNFKLQMNASYWSPYRDGIQLYNQHSEIDLAVQRKFLKNKLSVTLGVYDVFYHANGSYSSTLPGQSYYVSQRQDTRRMRLTLNYRFGNMKIDRKVEDEENGRVKKAN